jgi:hypothetical protein
MLLLLCAVLLAVVDFFVQVVLDAEMVIVLPVKQQQLPHSSSRPCC